MLIHSRLEADIDHYSRTTDLIVLPAPNPGGVQPTSFVHSSRLIGGALAAARQTLARGPLHPRLPLAA